MALALAAMSPPLRAQDVVRAANDLTARSAPAPVIRHLLTRGADLKKVRILVEALGARIKGKYGNCNIHGKNNNLGHVLYELKYTDRFTYASEAVRLVSIIT